MNFGKEFEKYAVMDHKISSATLHKFSKAPGYQPYSIYNRGTTIKCGQHGCF